MGFSFGKKIHFFGTMRRSLLEIVQPDGRVLNTRILTELEFEEGLRSIVTKRAIYFVFRCVN